MSDEVGAAGHQWPKGKDRSGVEVVVVGLLTSVLLLCLMAWLDNVHINTTNGLWKSIGINDWKGDFRSAPLDPSNYLYFPAMAALCHFLDWLGVHSDQTWKQMAVVSAAFAGIAVASVFALIRNLTGQFYAAAAAAVFHLGSAFFLSLAVSNEDILPSYTLVLVAMVMAAVWFGAPSAVRVASVSAIFTLGWLTEWRLVFPALPPLILALAFSPGSIRRRAGLILWFLFVMVAVVFFAVKCTEGHPGAVGLPGLFWTGKGVGTGWGGFSLDKLNLLPGGMGEYLLGGANLPVARLTDPLGKEWGGALLFELLLLVAASRLFWRRRTEAKMRAAAIVFFGVLVVGEVMNAYSQPSDPQMQLNVMPWLTLAVGLLLADILKSRSFQRVAIPALALSVLPLAYNVHVFAAARGRDGQMAAAVQQVENLTDRARTVFIDTGFEAIMAWQYALWLQHGQRPRIWGLGLCDLGPAPQAQPVFKWFALFAPIIYHPELTNEDYLSAIKTELDCAFNKGYRVVAGPVWSYSTQQLADAMTELNARSRAPALHAMFQTYRATPIGPSIANEGVYLEISRP